MIWHNKACIRPPTRRSLTHSLAFAALSLSSFIPGMATAQEQAIRIIVSLPAGGGVDAMARYLGQQLGAELRRPVVVENKPGASGTIAAKTVMNAPAGSLTLLAGGNQEITIAPHLLNDSNYKPLEALVPLMQIGIVPSVLVAKKDGGLNLGSLLQELKKSNELSVGIPGRGTPMHIALEDVAMESGGQFLAVPYKGAPDVLTGVLSSSTRYGAVGYPAAKSQLDGGNLTAIAVLANQRSKLLPNVPAIAEKTALKTELPQVWYGIFASKKSAGEDISKVSAALEHLLKQAEVRTRLQEMVIQVTALNTPTFAKALGAESDYYRNALVRYKVQ